VDVLSDVITALRTGSPHSSHTTRRAPWGQRFPATEAAGFHVVLEGDCWLFPSGHDAFRMTVGDVAFLPRGGAHGIADRPDAARSTDAPSRDGLSDGAPVTVLLCGAYGFDRSRSHPLLDQLPDVLHLRGRLGQRSPLRHAVELLAGELDRPGPGAAATVPALLDVLLLLILRTWLTEQAHTDSPVGWAAALADPALAVALDDIHSDPARPWTVAELAARAALSRATFARRFGTLVGRTPMAYLTWWRLTTAAQLLRATDAPLGVVAKRVGYGSEYAFANAFKRQYGVAPGRYRHGVGLRGA
jgi:AraC-like DNA-binding protein